MGCIDNLTSLLGERLQQCHLNLFSKTLWNVGRICLRSGEKKLASQYFLAAQKQVFFPPRLFGWKYGISCAFLGAVWSERILTACKRKFQTRNIEGASNESRGGDA
jgi:hypothetical protein